MKEGKVIKYVVPVKKEKTKLTEQEKEFFEKVWEFLGINKNG